ncbi:MAG: AI-2E family transporter [Bifidobacteriaceae bacterium]|jgi:predicted PurR-regulated permease PerM|nr:AI-2E family transporter [Bifidobacteriaceae bacterium]
MGQVDPRQEDVPRWLRSSAGVAWRLLVLVAAAAVVVRGVLAVELVAVALFVSAVITSVLRPLANLLDRVMPRALATIAAFLVALACFSGLATFVGVSVSNQIPLLTDQLIDGLEQINEFLAQLPAPLSDLDLTAIGENATGWLRQNLSTVVGEVMAQFSVVTEVMTTLVLAVFCSVFFINSGSQMWSWALSQTKKRTAAMLHSAGHAAWATFAGYTRGIVLVGSTNGLLAGIGLAVIGVPLATPIGVLVAIGTFIPYIGSAIAMSVAIVVALAAKGPWWALVVVAMIAVIGQIEGHLLQPLIMAKQVRLHPVVVATTVVGGLLVGGVIGAIVAVPVVAVIWSVFSTLRADRAEDGGEEAGPAADQPQAIPATQHIPKDAGANGPDCAKIEE